MRWIECFASDWYNLIEFDEKSERNKYCHGKRFALYEPCLSGELLFSDKTPIFVSDSENSVRDYHRKMIKNKLQLDIYDISSGGFDEN